MDFADETLPEGALMNAGLAPSFSEAAAMPNPSLLEALPLGLCLFGPGGAPLFANGQARRLFNGTPTLADLFPGTLGAALTDRLTRGEPVPGHDLPAHTGGQGEPATRRILRIEAAALPEADAQAPGIAVTITDVTAQRPLAVPGRELQAVLDGLPVAVYTTDAEGWITFQNPAAATLCGRWAAPGSARYCASARIFWPDGRPMLPEETAIAIALREGRAINGSEVVVERPDGSRLQVLPFPSPVLDQDGRITGAVNMLVDLTDQRLAGDAAQRLAAVVESSDDAILTKDLNGIIATWNKGAERLFGFTAAEVIGQPITILIPTERLDEEAVIIGRIRRGEGVEHFETTRLRKDGSLVDISLSVSPVRNAWGEISGASKIARDITHRRRSDDHQKLMLREMHHRIKNLFTLASGVVALSTAFASSPTALASAVQARLNALARAHELTLPSPGSQQAEQPASLHALIRTVFAAYEHGSIAGRVIVHGDDVEVTATSVTALALMLHEFATNAAKYGALSTALGQVEVSCRQEGPSLLLVWRELGGPSLAGPPESEGFGTFLAQATVGEQLGGTIIREWYPEGLIITVSLESERLLG